MRKTSRRRLLAAVMAGGCLFAGPCGITTLQLKDFLTSAGIQTVVSTVATLVETAVVSQAAQNVDEG
jgi:hypothetical protein